MFGMVGRRYRNLSKHSKSESKDYFPWVGVEFLFSMFCTAMICFPLEWNSNLLKCMNIVVALGFKENPRYTPYVSPGSQISHIAINKDNINTQCLIYNILSIKDITLDNK